LEALWLKLEIKEPIFLSSQQYLEEGLTNE
jgi:hypothetical protein